MAVIKSTPEAMSAIGRMKLVINSGLADHIRALDSDGQLLMNPDNWAGPLAARFQETWPGMHGNLRSLQEQLAQLNVELERIQANIQAAGGA